MSAEEESYEPAAAAEETAPAPATTKPVEEAAAPTNGTDAKPEKEGEGGAEEGPAGGKDKEEGGEEEGSRSGRDKERKSSRRRSSRSRSRSRGRRDRKEKRRSRSRERSGSPASSSRRKRSKERERGGSSRRSRRSASGSPSPASAARQRRRRERANNWDKPPEGGVLPTNLPALGGNLGALGVPIVTPGNAAYVEPPMLDPGVMMGTKPAGSLGLHQGVVRGAIGTLTAPTAPPNQQEMCNGVLIPTMLVRQAKRLYVGNVPVGCDQFVLMQLFNQAMVAAGKGSAESPPIVGVQVNEMKPFAFLETRTPEDAANVLLFDGLTIGANQLKVRRPKDFKPLPGIIDPPTGATLIPGHLPTSVDNTENKIYLGSIPTHFNEQQVRELVTAFGDLKAFNLVRDPASGASKGFAFFEYVDSTLTERVCVELNGFELGDRKLICQRANPTPPVGGAAPRPIDPAYSAMLGMGAMIPGAVPVPQAPLGPATRILKLSNMVVAEELWDDGEYEEIVADIREECTKYGAVLSLKVPRPTYKEDGSVDVAPPMVGEVYVEFADPSGALAAGNALRNRQFSGRTVLCGFLAEDEYAAGNLA